MQEESHDMFQIARLNLLRKTKQENTMNPYSFWCELLHVFMVQISAVCSCC